MSKYIELSEENEKLFREVLNETNIPEWLVFRAFDNDKQKRVCEIGKTTDIVQAISDGVNFTIIFNEEIFDGLTPLQQRIALHECLAGVAYDPEKDSISLTKPDINTHSSILKKYGNDDVIAFKESEKSLYEAKKVREDEEKAVLKASKTKKNVFPQ